MTYRVEYNGDDIELATLDVAIDNAKQAIAADVGPISGWTVEHDETINDWFVQGVLDGSRIGPTAVISGPEITAPASPSGQVYPSAGAGDWSRRVSFAGATPVEVFDRAAAWLAQRAGLITVGDVSWQPDASGPRLRIYYR
jgi:hypothetical protein